MSIQQKSLPKGFNMADTYSKFGIFVILFLAIIVSTILNPSFLNAENLINILRQNTVVAIVAFGAMLVLISGEVDLSPGSVAAFSGCLATMAMKGTKSVVVAVLIGLAVSAALGFINGLVITKLCIPSFVMTLATQMAIRGFTYIITDNTPINQLGESFAWLGQGYIGFIPVPVILLAIIFIFSWWLLNKRPFGRYVYAVGGNKTAAKASGINVDAIKIKAFLFQGVMAGISGVLLMSRLNSGQPTSGIAMEFDAITAAIIGGTSMTGGIGNVYGTLAGALFVGVLINIMTLMNLGGHYQQVARGLIIAIAVIIDMSIRRSKKM